MGTLLGVTKFVSAIGKTIRAFIISTFTDMQAEWDRFVGFVVPKLREELLKHRIRLIDAILH